MINTFYRLIHSEEQEFDFNREHALAMVSCHGTAQLFSVYSHVIDDPLAYEQSNDAHGDEMTAMCVDSYQNKGYHDIIAQSNHHRRARPIRL